MPPGLDVTVPLPMPVLLTVRTNCSRKAATPDLDMFIVRPQTAAFVESHPLQLSNLDPAAGVAVRFNAVPAE